MSLATVEHIALSEAIFKRFYQPDKPSSGLGILARKLSVVYDKLKDMNKKCHYEVIADESVTGAL